MLLKEFMVSKVKVFEIGTVFGETAESLHVGLGVQTGTTYKAKVDDPLLVEAQTALATVLATPLSWMMTEASISEFSLDEATLVLPRPTFYAPSETRLVTPYQPFSVYPSASRDIALFVPLTTTAEEVEQVLRPAAGNLCVRATLFDTFIKVDRTSYAFRFVFQSNEKTLEASEVDERMALVYAAALKVGWETR